MSLLDVPAGVIEAAGEHDHRVVMHLSAPVFAARRIGDLQGPLRCQVAGDLDIIPAGADGAWMDEGRAILITLRMSAQLLAGAAEFFGAPEPATQLRDPWLQRALSLAARTLLHPRPDPNILETAAMAAARRLGGAAPQDAVRGRLTGPRLRAVVEAMEERLGDKVTIAELAEIAGLRVSQFSTAFKQALGVTPHRFLVDIRLRHARTLIEQNREPFAQVAAASGFTDQSHLTNTMRRRWGVTPGQLAPRPCLHPAHRGILQGVDPIGA